MSKQPWKQYVAAMCRLVLGLDARAAAEVVRCIEESIAADGITDSAETQVFLSFTSELGTGRSAMTVRIQNSA